jgi:hypothetical protein
MINMKISSIVLYSTITCFSYVRSFFSYLCQNENIPDDFYIKLSYIHDR